MIPGTLYFFKVVANNFEGSSVYSNEIIVSASSLPIAPSAPFKDNTQSTLTSIFSEWNTVTDPSSPIIGYRLFMDQGNNGNF